MSNRVEAYINDILRGIQEALETEARGADLIRIAREAKRAQKLLKQIILLSTRSRPKAK
jgi:hypothetical protein